MKLLTAGSLSTCNNNLNLLTNYSSFVGQPIMRSDNRSLTTEKTAEPDSVMTVPEVAKFLKYSTKKIYRLCRSGEIPFKRNGGNYRFWRPEIEKWLKGELYE